MEDIYENQLNRQNNQKAKKPTHNNIVDVGVGL